MDNVGMDLKRTENFLHTDLDEKLVSEVSKNFNRESALDNLKELMDRRKKEKTVGSVCGFLNTLGQIDDDTSNYYSSYDAHLELLDKEIQEQKASILRGLKRLELLVEKEKLVTEEAKKVTQDTWELPSYLKEYSEMEGLLREHIVHKHPLIIGDYYGEHRYSSHAGRLNIEPVYNKEGKLVKLRCMDCYKKWLLKDETSCYKDDGELDLHDHVGGK